MLQSLNFPLCKSFLDQAGGWDGLRDICRTCGLDGIEAIWAEEPDMVPPADLLVGYHLFFQPDWLDFYRDDRVALTRKFGSPEAAYAFYGGQGAEHLIGEYRADLERAAVFGAKYVVFHVSDVSLEEGYTYRWEHSSEEVIDAAVEAINAALQGFAPTFDFLVENQWWPGFTMTERTLTERLLNGIVYPKRGILLDTGHLMNCNTALQTEEDGVQYIHEMLDQHGELVEKIKGIHLHKSLSGSYVQAWNGKLPQTTASDYITRFGESYGHILQIDRHQPWTDSGIASVIERIHPLYLTHELAASSLKEKIQHIQTQKETMRKGGIS